MAFLGQTYSAAELPEGNTGDFEPLPAGWYSATIASASVETTKAGTGNYIKVRYDITGPTHQGRVVFANINIRNPNPKAEEIGRQQLGDIMRAIGLESVSDTDQLIGGSLQIKLTVKPATNDYPAGNEVRGFKSLSGSAMPAPSAQTQPETQSNGASTPPWARK